MPASDDLPSYQFTPVSQRIQPEQRANVTYELILRQQPKQSRMCGVGEKGKFLNSSPNLASHLHSFIQQQQQQQPQQQQQQYITSNISTVSGTFPFSPLHSSSCPLTFLHPYLSSHPPITAPPLARYSLYRKKNGLRMATTFHQG
ncbi:MAG: hypothetical protein J3R72DRAFT_103220 [Linnemannia gamsii]|nr:MAG: hypothetical protein J3R72DRAFT_103220 [Linnemannia gamsii]